MSILGIATKYVFYVKRQDDRLEKRLKVYKVTLEIKPPLGDKENMFKVGIEAFT